MLTTTELLSTNFCSLREKEEKLTFSCIWEMDRDANIINTRYCKSVICSRAAMTYDEAQLKIDDVTQQDSLVKSLRNLNNLAKTLKKRRLDNGYAIWVWVWVCYKDIHDSIICFLLQSVIISISRSPF